MTNPSGNLNRKITDPTLADLLNLLKRDIFLNMNCHAIATIQSFDPTNQTVTATIAYKKSVLEQDANGIYSTVLLDYPILVDVPAFVLGGGAFNMTFPIAANDEAIILFNDRDIDNWFQSGQVGELASNRLHSFSDGIALVGLHSLARSISDYDMNHGLISSGKIRVGVSTTKVVAGNATDTLGPLLQDLITEIRALVTATAAITVTTTAFLTPSSVPVNAAAITAVSAQLAATAVKLAGLLE